MALYCDNQLRTCLNDLDEKEIFIRIDNIMSLISILNYHLPFIDYYELHLSDRLKMNNCISIAELLMIDQMK